MEATRIVLYPGSLQPRSFVFAALCINLYVQTVSPRRTNSRTHTLGAIENWFQVSNIGDMEPTLEQAARSLIESGDYRITSRLQQQTEYHPADGLPKLVAAVVDVETTGTNSDRDKIIELGICPFEYDRQNGRIYKVLGSWEWFEDPGFSIPSEITKITDITDEMVAAHRIDDRAVND